MKTCAACEGFGMQKWPDELFRPCGLCKGRGFISPGQTKRMSLVEISTSTAIGFVVAYLANAVVMPAFGHHVTAVENFWITSIFTVISIVRGYCVRRLFEALR